MLGLKLNYVSKRDPWNMLIGHRFQWFYICINKIVVFTGLLPSLRACKPMWWMEHGHDKFKYDLLHILLGAKTHYLIG